MGAKNRKYHDFVIGDPGGKFQEKLGFDSDNLDIYKDPDVPEPTPVPEPESAPSAADKNEAKRYSVKRQRRRRGRQSTILTSGGGGRFGG